jgi:transposase-like protein
MLTKVTVETALNAELDDHLGYEKHSPTNDSNSRNGYSSKRLITDDVICPSNTGHTVKRHFVFQS